MTFSSKSIWTIFAGLCIALLLGILVLAYLGNIPSFISAIPYYDKVGHFFLFGLCGYVLHRASGRKYFYIFPIAIVLFSGFTVLEEGLQSFSGNRTFSFIDLLFSLFGIWFFFFLDLKASDIVKSAKNITT